MNLFLEHALISLNTAPTTQNTFLMIMEKNVLMIRNVSNKSSKHSKSSGLSTDFLKMQDYLFSDILSTEDKQLLFKFRTRTYPCKTNFRQQYQADLSCQICHQEDSPQHLFNCALDGVDINGTKYEDIFGNVEQQSRVIKVLKKITVKRDNIINKSPPEGSQVHPL